MTMKEWRKLHPGKAAEHSQAQRAKDPEKMRKLSRESYNRHRETRLAHGRDAYNQALIEKPEAVKHHSRRSWLGWKYHLTPEKYEKKYDAQDGRCAICRRWFARLCVDHNHETGEVRDLLCRLCNMMVGWIERDSGAAQSALVYVLRWTHGEDE